MERTPEETYIDTETGEILYPSQYNAETGEYEGTPIPPQRTKFRIPPPPEKSCTKNLQRPTKITKRELELITAAIFLLPSMILFYPIVSIVTVITEILLHNWAHRKNRTLRDDKFYYKSPLHGIVKELCGRCKEQNAKEKITKIQDMRNDKMRKYGLEYVRRVVT